VITFLNLALNTPEALSLLLLGYSAHIFSNVRLGARQGVYQCRYGYTQVSSSSGEHDALCAAVSYDVSTIGFVHSSNAAIQQLLSPVAPLDWVWSVYNYSRQKVREVRLLGDSSSFIHYFPQSL
jgi:hypothetical protein